jgi:hypothetical protein
MSYTLNAFANRWNYKYECIIIFTTVSGTSSASDDAADEHII